MTDTSCAMKGIGGKRDRKFTYDRCFWSCNPKDAHFADQKMVFAFTGKPIIQNAYEGFNCCIFAYGQTGAGKSFSMMGAQNPSHLQGLIPRICNQLFSRVEKSKKAAAE